MLAAVTAKAKAGADATERAAKSAKLKADILMLENKLKTVKMEFGKDVYPAMAAGDRNTTETLFMTTKAPIPSTGHHESQRTPRGAASAQGRPHNCALPVGQG